MATPQENAAMSDAVYGGPGKTKAPAGWTLVAESPTTPGNEGSANGYFGAAFRNNQTGEIVVANRGSRMSGEGLKQDWAGSDVDIARQNPANIPPAFGDSEAFANQVQAQNPGAKISYTGHSLGGAHAQVQAARLGGEATTFGAPGVKFAVTDAQAKAAEGKVTNYALPGDPVAMSGDHIGEKRMLTPSGKTLATDLAAIGIGLVVGGPLGLLIAVAGIAATHMLGNYIDALASLPSMPSLPSFMAGVGRPQSRVGDMHVCPMVTPGTPPVPHVGGPVLPPGCPTVLVGGMPAARVGDMCVCVGPPDVISLGSFTVLIGGQPAARLGDMTAHGGALVMGLPTFLTGG
jgi:uncharacterized Zn-binding protein involved in type VI secretion